MINQQIINKKLCLVIMILVILCPSTVLAATNGTSESTPDGYSSKCQSYLGISITASAYKRSTNVSNNTVSARTISMTCKGRCKYYIYYADYGNLEKLESDSNTKSTSDSDEDNDDLVKIKKKNFTDSASWTLPAGKEALIVVISLNNKNCSKYDEKDKTKCIEWKYPQKVAQEQKCDSEGKNCKWENVQYCSATDTTGKCTTYSNVTCPRGRFNTDDTPTSTDEVELKGNGAALFVENPNESGLIENLRHKDNSDFGDSCKNAYNAKYDSDNPTDNEKYSIIDASDLNDYRQNYYGKILNYCETTYVPFNLKASQIKKISNKLLKVFYYRKKLSSGDYKDIATINSTISTLESSISSLYGLDHVFENESGLTRSLSCDKKSSVDTMEEYLYKTKEEKVTAELSTGTVPVCTVRCYEHLTVKYNPPALVKAGLCFSYKVTVKSVSECGIKDDFDLSKVSVPNMCSPSPICENSASHTQPGPNEEFDSCIKKCDNGKYSQKCINQCYKEIYSNNKNIQKKTNYNKKDTVMTNLNYSRNRVVVKFIANSNDYSEEDLKDYYKENNNKSCTTEKIINYVKNSKSNDLKECAEYFFQAKALYPYGNYNKSGTQWNPSSFISDAGATNEETTNIPMQIGRASPFYLRSVSETIKTLQDLVGPAVRTGFWKKYNITSHGIKRQYSTRYKCNQSCSFTGCSNGDIFTSSKFSNNTADDLDKLADALSKCNASAACDTKVENKTSTFEIKINVKRDNSAIANESQTGTTELYKTNGNGDMDTDGDGNADMFVAEGRNDTGTGILGLCYDNRDTPHYQTTITYPGTWINYKNAKRVYTSLNDPTYFYKKNYFCTPYDASNVNEKYFIWALQNNYNPNNYPNDFTPEYNIEAYLGKSNNGFGKYNWKINFNCFYSLYNCIPGTKECPYESSCSSENSTKLCNGNVRVVDSAVLFPDENGKSITDESQLPFNWTSAAQDLDVEHNPSLIEKGYGINPAEYRKQVEAESTTSFDRNMDYHIHLTKDNILNIKNYIKSNPKAYSSYLGKYNPVQGIEGLYYYTTNLENDTSKVSEFHRYTQLGRNND